MLQMNKTQSPRFTIGKIKDAFAFCRNQRRKDDGNLLLEANQTIAEQVAKLLKQRKKAWRNISNDINLKSVVVNWIREEEYDKVFIDELRILADYLDADLTITLKPRQKNEQRPKNHPI